MLLGRLGAFVRPYCPGGSAPAPAPALCAARGSGSAGRCPAPLCGWMPSASPFPPHILPPLPRPEAAPPHPHHPLSLFHPRSPRAHSRSRRRERRAAAARPAERLQDGRGGDHHLHRPDGEVQPSPGQLQETQTPVLQQRGALPADPPGWHRGWHQGPQRRAHSAPAERRKRGGGAHQEHPVGAVPGHGHQRAALRLGVTG